MGLTGGIRGRSTRPRVPAGRRPDGSTAPPPARRELRRARCSTVAHNGGTKRGNDDNTADGRRARRGGFGGDTGGRGDRRGGTDAAPHHLHVLLDGGRPSGVTRHRL